MTAGATLAEPRAKMKALTGLGSLVALLVLPTLGCSDAQGNFGNEMANDAEHIGSINLELKVVPPDVSCLRVTVSAGPTVTRDFNLSSGSATTALSLDRLPLGNVGISAAAYEGACNASAPAWIADAEHAELRPGVVSTVALTFRRNNPVTATANFVGNIQDIAAGAASTLLVVDGSIYRWGTIAPSQTRRTPSLMPNFTDVVQVAAGKDHACAIKSDRTLWCWGRNASLQLGRDTLPGGVSEAPLQITFPGSSNSFDSITAGATHSCANVGGATSCWGGGVDGQLANGVLANSALPVSLTSALPSSSRLGADSSTTCYVNAFLQVNCSGIGSAGQLGNGSTLDSGRGVVATGITPAISVAGGMGHSCGVMANGTAKCWGANSLGQLGDGTTTQRLQGVTVSGLSNLVNIQVGVAHSCALNGDGQVRCWGRNDLGQLGDGSLTNRSVPTTPLKLPSVKLLAVGSNHNCVVTTANAVLCWGYNHFSQVGNGSNVTVLEPLEIMLP